MDTQNLSLTLHPPPPRPPPQAATSLHSVRKPPAKPWRKPEPPPPKVYRVDPRGFRGLVQQLTGSPKQQSGGAARPLRDTVIPPPPLHFAAPPVQQTFVDNANTFGAGQQPQVGMTGFLSPTWLSPWCSVPLLSPGTMAAMDNSPRAIV